jgi:hypothetical protein
MKLTLTGLFLGLMAVPMMASAACPEVKGNYICRTGIFSRQVSVSQVIRGGTTIYRVDNGGEIFADGIRHQTPSLHPMLDQHARNYSYKAVCAPNKVSFTGVADLVRGGQGNVDGRLVKQGSGLTIQMRMVTPDEVTDISLSCTP